MQTIAQAEANKVGFLTFLFIILVAQELHIRVLRQFSACCNEEQRSLNVTRCALLQGQLPSKPSCSYVQSWLSGAPALLFHKG